MKKSSTKNLCQSIFQTFWKVHCCPNFLLLDLETFGYLFIIRFPLILIVLGWSKFFVPDLKCIFILWRSWSEIPCSCFAQIKFKQIYQNFNNNKIEDKKNYLLEIGAAVHIKNDIFYWSKIFFGPMKNVLLSPFNK